MGTYLHILRQRAVLRVLASQLLARLPMGLISMGVLIYIQSATGKYALAGVVVGSLSIGEALLVPLSSRYAAHFDTRWFLFIVAMINAGVLLLLVFAPTQETILVALGLVAGLTTPPFGAVVRALFPLMANEEDTRSLFAIDTASQELLWIVGPVLAAISAATFGPSAPLILCSIFTLVGTVWFSTSPLLKTVTLPKSTNKFGKVLRNHSLQIASITIFTIVASWTSFEVGLLKMLDADAFWMGMAIAVSGIGSLTGALTLGNKKLGLRATILVLLVTAIGTGLNALTYGNPALFVLTLFISGFGFAPAFASLLLMISHAVTPEDAAESFGWTNTAALVGGAAGTAIGGYISDMFDFQATFAVTTLLAFAAIGALLISRLFGPILGLSKIQVRSESS